MLMKTWYIYIASRKTKNSYPNSREKLKLRQINKPWIINMNIMDLIC